MRIFRLTRKKYKDDLSGTGASLSGNRWNSKGTRMIYCAESRALALAEIAVHLPIALIPSDFVMLEFNVPASVSIAKIRINQLPADWNKFPHITPTQKIGDKHIADNLHCIFRVPSAVVHGDFNYLINPLHGDFRKVKLKEWTDFPVDHRLMR